MSYSGFAFKSGEFNFGSDSTSKTSATNEVEAKLVSMFFRLTQISNYKEQNLS
jgi:hypothetical protein